MEIAINGRHTKDIVWDCLESGEYTVLEQDTLPHFGWIYLQGKRSGKYWLIGKLDDSSYTKYKSYDSFDSLNQGVTLTHKKWTRQKEKWGM